MKISKNLLCVLLLFMICTSFFGCHSDSILPEESLISIENIDWQFRSVQGADGSVIYCTEGNKSLYNGAEVIDIRCTANDGVMTITDNDNGKSWLFRYQVNNETMNNIIYDIALSAENQKQENEEVGITRFEDKQGYATLGITTYDDSTFDYTLIISIAGYAIYFNDPGVRTDH